MEAGRQRGAARSPWSVAARAPWSAAAWACRCCDRASDDRATASARRLRGRRRRSSLVHRRPSLSRFSPCAQVGYFPLPLSPPSPPCHSRSLTRARLAVLAVLDLAAARDGFDTIRTCCSPDETVCAASAATSGNSPHARRDAIQPMQSRCDAAYGLCQGRGALSQCTQLQRSVRRSQGASETNLEYTHATTGRLHIAGSQPPQQRPWQPPQPASAAPPVKPGSAEKAGGGGPAWHGAPSSAPRDSPHVTSVQREWQPPLQQQQGAQADAADWQPPAAGPQISQAAAGRQDSSSRWDHRPRGDPFLCSPAPMNL